MNEIVEALGPHDEARDSLAGVVGLAGIVDNAGLDHQALERFLVWIRPLQQALSLEVDRGFSNLQGRNERFDSFMQRELGTPPQMINT